MDRNIRLYYMHKRNPLQAKRLAEIKQSRTFTVFI